MRQTYDNKFYNCTNYRYISINYFDVKFSKKWKKLLLKYQTMSSFLYAIQYAFLGAFCGSLMNLTCMARNFIFNKYNNKVPIYWLIIIVLLMITFSLITYVGIISLLPMFAVVLYSIAVWHGNLKLIRYTEVFSCCLFIVYNIKVLAITGLIATIIELIAALIAIYRFDIKKPKQ